jgi:dynein light intermediate chain 1
MLNDTLLS